MAAFNRRRKSLLLKSNLLLLLYLANQKGKAEGLTHIKAKFMYRPKLIFAIFVERQCQLFPSVRVYISLSAFLAELD